ncbi:MAG TPA: hypothetical protein VGR29_01905 [Thermomicrobiales bacterium]|nr:hypothetical protein [Thermomicrobiales bacterium]
MYKVTPSWERDDDARIEPAVELLPPPCFDDRGIVPALAFWRGLALCLATEYRSLARADLGDPPAPRVNTGGDHDDYFRRLIPEGPVGEAFTGFLTGAPAPVTRIDLHAIRDVRMLADGRVGALVTLVDPDAPGPEEADLRFVVFVMVGDRWLIDEVIELETTGTPIP